MIAQAMRAILLATATATSLAGFLASSRMIYDPGMLLRMPPGVVNNGRCTDDE